MHRYTHAQFKMILLTFIVMLMIITNVEDDETVIVSKIFKDSLSVSVSLVWGLGHNVSVMAIFKKKDDTTPIFFNLSSSCKAIK